jgi:hypothetical protein
MPTKALINAAFAGKAAGGYAYQIQACIHTAAALRLQLPTRCK